MARPSPLEQPLSLLVAGLFVLRASGFCTNECSYPNDQMCDDGGANSSYSICDFGTDCADCGPRTSADGDFPEGIDLGFFSACTDCPTACQERSDREEEMCTTAMWNKDGICNPTCNNWECNHDGNDCTPKQAYDACKIEQEREGSQLKQSPSKTTPLEFNILEFESLNVNLDEGSNQWVLEVGLKVSLRWHDLRLSTTSCRHALPEMLSFEKGVHSEDRAWQELARGLIWTPTFALNGSAITFQPDTEVEKGGTKNEIGTSNTTYVQSESKWLGGLEPSSAEGKQSSCAYCIQQNFTFTWKVTINPTLKYTTYPFDNQQFNLQFDFGPNVDVFTCEKLLDVNGSYLAELKKLGELRQLLPSTQEYRFEYTLSGEVGKTVTTRHPLDGDGNADPTKCEIIVHAQRDSWIVFLKVRQPAAAWILQARKIAALFGCQEALRA